MIHTDDYITKGPTSQPGTEPVAAAPQLLPVPDNLLDMADRRTLQMAELWAGSMRSWEVQAGKVSLPGKPGTTEYLRGLHAHLMQDVYPEVGATRQDDFARVTEGSAEDRLVPRARLSEAGARIELLAPGKVNERLDALGNLLEQENHLRGMEHREFVERLAEYYVNYRQAAPFTHGTEAVLNTAFARLGQQAGYDVDSWSKQDEVGRAADSVLAGGPEAERRELFRTLGSVVTEAPGEAAELRRRATMQVLRPELPESLVRMQASEHLTQAGSRLVGRVGGQEGERLSESLRALREGSVDPGHINALRTVARTHGGPELAAVVRRIEVHAGELDGWRKGDQQAAQAQASAQARPTREVAGPAPQLAQ